jgi:hypothetical protein
MSPEHKTDMISGPPTLVNLSNDPKKGLAGTIDNEDIEKSQPIIFLHNNTILSTVQLFFSSLSLPYHNMFRPQPAAIINQKTNSVVSVRNANYTDRATAACRRS